MFWCIHSSRVFWWGSNSLIHRSCDCKYDVMECIPKKVRWYKRIVHLFCSVYILTCETQRVLCKPLKFFFNGGNFFLCLCYDWICIIFQTFMFPSQRVDGILFPLFLLAVDHWWCRICHKKISKKYYLHSCFVSWGNHPGLKSRGGIYIGVCWIGIPFQPS